jgi:hypothetical protein
MDQVGDGPSRNENKAYKDKRFDDKFATEKFPADQVNR